MKDLNHYLNEQEELNELSLEKYTKAIQKEQGRGLKQSKNIEKLALELIKRGETEQVKDKRGTVNKIELPNGYIEYRNDKGELHREDGPAVEISDGDKAWYLNGKRHRTDGPAFEYPNGDKEWYLNDKRHREDGPAIEWNNGDKFWWINGKLHREDGPACEWNNGSKFWYLNGKEYSEEEWKKKTGN
jgi:hypothetical protein